MMGDEISTAYIGTINFEVYNTIISAIDRARREVAATGLGYEHPIEAGFLYNVNTVLLSFQCEDSFMLDRTINVPYIVLVNNSPETNNNYACVFKFDWGNLQKSELYTFLSYAYKIQDGNTVSTYVFADNIIHEIIKLYNDLFQDLSHDIFFLAPDDIRSVPSNLYYNNWDIGAVDTRWVNRVLDSIGIRFSIEKNNEGNYRVMGHAQSC